MGSAELQLAIRLGLDLEALLVHGAVVAPTQQGQVGQRRGAALGPVADVMALPVPDAAPREAAAAVPVLQRPP